jgi:hypothetical protein
MYRSQEPKKEKKKGVFGCIGRSDDQQQQQSKRVIIHIENLWRTSQPKE